MTDAKPTAAYTKQQIQQIATLTRQRVTALRTTPKALERESNVSYVTWRRLLEGSAPTRLDARRRVEDALGLLPGTIDQTLEGEISEWPAVGPLAAPAPHLSVEQRLERIEEILLDIMRFRSELDAARSQAAPEPTTKGTPDAPDAPPTSRRARR